MNSYFLWSLIISLIVHSTFLLDLSSSNERSVRVEVSSSRSSFKVNLNKKEKKKENLKSRVIKKTAVLKKENSFESDQANTSVDVKSKYIPKYPYKSRIFREEGVVIVEVILSQDGDVLHSTIIKSSGYNRLDEAALIASKKSSFAIIGGESNNRISHSLEFDFKLSN